MPAVDESNIEIKDYLHVKGVRLVEPGTPQWKIKPLQEKNLKLINEYLEEEREKQKEEEKWAAIPEWKQQLLKEKEKKSKELEETRRLLEEEERKERDKFESLPQWKQQLLIKKKSLSEIDVNSDTKSESSAASEAKSDNALIPEESNNNNGHMETVQDVQLNNPSMDWQDKISESSQMAASTADCEELVEQME